MCNGSQRFLKHCKDITFFVWYFMERKIGHNYSETWLNRKQKKKTEQNSSVSLTDEKIYDIKSKIKFTNTYLKYNWLQIRSGMRVSFILRYTP